MQEFKWKSNEEKSKVKQMFNKIARFFKDKIEYRQWIKKKPCGACEYFRHFHGSAGVCTADTSEYACNKGLIDITDFCSCNFCNGKGFKKKKGY